MKKSLSYLVIAAVIPLITTGCATGPLTAVSESSKDSSGRYDGSWLGEFTNTAPIQRGTGSVSYMRCGDRTGRKLGTFSVDDGKIGFSHGNKPVETFVNAKGGFKFVYPIDSGGFSGGSNTFTSKQDTITISGSLEAGEGTWREASIDLGGAGCSSSVSFERRGD